MPAKRLSMRKIREVLRLRYEVGLGIHQIAVSCAVGHTAVAGYLKRAEAAGVRWPLQEGMDEARLERLLFPPPPLIPSSERCVPVWADIHAELRRKGVTLGLLWEEYRAEHPKDRIPVQPVLRSLSRVAGEVRSLDAAGSPLGREDVRRLLWADGSCDRPENRRNPRGRDLRGGPGSEQLHLCRGHLDAVPSRLDRLAPEGLCLFRRRHRTPHPRQHAVWRVEKLPLRARSQPDVSGHGVSLRDRRDPRAGATSPGQGESGSRRADRGALDTRRTSQPRLLQSRRAQWRDRRASREAERPSLQKAPRQPPLAVRGDRSARLFALFPPCPTSTPSGRRQQSGSTITSRSSGTTTACRISWPGESST